MLSVLENYLENRDQCCGCSACEQVCSHKAISMNYDDEGFVYPVLNKALCIDCSLCSKVCPILNSDSQKTTKSDIAPFLSINKDDDILKNSSSGGVFSAISSYVISLGGIVYGAAFDEDMKLCHIGVDSLDELYKLRGSKYLQSSNGNVYNEIKKDLKSGRWVYYTGTGCQVAGLKSFLMKSYPTLITSDLICHGTPSPLVFDYVISAVEKKYKAKVISYQFRDKKINGWSCSSSSSVRRNNKDKYIGFDSIMYSYFNMFISGSINREVCYSCPFATIERTGDITLADYWGVRKFHTVHNAQKGVSAILVNTQKGQDVISALEWQLHLEPTRVEWIAEQNENLTKRTLRPSKRTDFYRTFKDKPKAVLKQYKPLVKTWMKFKIKEILLSYPDLYKILKRQ